MTHEGGGGGGKFVPPLSDAKNISGEFGWPCVGLGYDATFLFIVSILRLLPLPWLAGVRYLRCVASVAVLLSFFVVKGAL